MAVERLQKILARGGFASRRAAERVIAEGRVRVNGRVVTELGSKADPFKDKVEVNGERVVAERAVYVVLHKPRGVVTTMSDPEGRPSVREILAPIGARVFPVGRLDFATSGVLLATNDGDFAEGLMHPKKAVPKTYVVKVANKMEPADLDRWREGIRLEDGMTLPAKAKMLRHEGDKTWFELTIREGRNQQIRRMGDATGFPVMRLSRVSFAGITNDDLRPGEWRHLTREELILLKQDYGIPKRIVVGDDRDALHGRSSRGALARGARGKEPRAADARGAEARGGRGRSGRERGAGGEAPARVRRAEGEKGDVGSRGRSPRAPAGWPSAAREGQRAEEPKSPRYGGGSPGRRGYDVRQDWGGGAGRGRTDSDREEARGDSPRRGSSGDARRGTGTERPARDDRPRGEVGGGRGAPSRTTGSGGGIGGARDGNYRMPRGRK